MVPELILLAILPIVPKETDIKKIKGHNFTRRAWELI
jgi:hypothetical protein